MVFAGCAVGGRARGNGGQPNSDAAVMDAAPTVDADPEQDAMTDATTEPSPDAGTQCGDTQLLCGGVCVARSENVPEEGCSLGCSGPCPAVANANTICSAEGACDFECQAPYVRDGAGCICVPLECGDAGAQCGEVSDGCGGTLTCGACGDGLECVDGNCGCPADAAEPNEERSVAHNFDKNGVDDNVGAFFSEEGFSLSSEVDQDWFTVRITDGDTANPTIQVTLDALSGGSDYGLAAYFDCDEGGELTSCADGDVDNTVGRGCRSDGPGAIGELVTLNPDCDRFLSANDSGTLYVRVWSNVWENACVPYRLQVSIME